MIKTVDLNAPRAVLIGDETYFVVRSSNRVYAARSHCPHRGGPLHLGDLSDGAIQCPWHGTKVPVHYLCQTAVPAIRIRSSFLIFQREGTT